MVKTLLGKRLGTSTNSALVRHTAIDGGLDRTDGGSGRVAAKFYRGGTITKLTCYVSLNSINTGTSTLLLDINNADGNNTCSIGSGTTGWFEDASSSDTIASNDLLCYQQTTSGSSGSMIIDGITCIFDPSASFYRLQASLNTLSTVSLADVTYYFPGGQFSGSTTESRNQQKIRASGTWRNLGINIQTNTRSTASTLVSRINGSTGNQSVSITASTTGFYQDNSNSDTVADGDLICVYLTFTAGTGSLNGGAIWSEMDNSTKQELINAGSYTHGTNATRWQPISGGQTSAAIGSEAQTTQKMLFDCTLSNLRANTTTNTLTSACTLTTRKNSGAGNQSVSITALTTGWFEDTGNTDTVTAGETWNTRLVTVAGGTSIVNSSIMVTATQSTSTGFAYTQLIFMN